MHLDLSLCERVEDVGVSNLAALTTLVSVDLSFCEYVSDSGVAALADSLPALKVLETLNLF